MGVYISNNKKRLIKVSSLREPLAKQTIDYAKIIPFIDTNSATVDISNLKLIQLSETQLLALENNNNVEPNQIYITYDDNTTPVFPVGAIYLSTTQVSPASMFGGTWEQIKDRFLLAAGSTYTNGSTGGEATHTLTLAETPPHSHSVHTFPYGGSSRNYYCVSPSPGGNVNEATSWTGGYTNTVGSGNSHNNMPPYLTVYMWKRIS